MEPPALAAAPADITVLGVRGPWSLGAGPDILSPESVRPDSPYRRTAMDQDAQRQNEKRIIGDMGDFDGFDDF